MRLTRHVCPRNCFDTCSLHAYVDENGQLVKVSGDAQQLYTAGTLCSKGYSYVQYVYNQKRILYPMQQNPRGSGNWERISWDEAMRKISEQILKNYKDYGSFLPIAYLRGSGNIGILAKAMEGMLSSLGDITVIGGTLCGAAGQDAQVLDFGAQNPMDPEQMAKADCVILWGVNPASNAIHQMRILQQVRKRGGQVILIDVISTATATQVDNLISVRPGGDGALALATLRELLYKNRIDHRFLVEKTEGWDALRDWLLDVDPARLYEVAGVTAAQVSDLADRIIDSSSVAFWIGMGMQRYSNSGQNVRAIHALAAAGGFLDNLGGIYAPYFPDAFFADLWSTNSNPRTQGIRKIGAHALESQRFSLDPPVRMLWVSMSNILTQGTDLQTLKHCLNDIDFVVSTDHYFTETVNMSDIVLPATTLFEAEDVVLGYWHKWLSLNEQAISPLGEARSELEIARSLTRMLNTLEPGLCPFPADRTAQEWLEIAISPEISAMAGIKNVEDLGKGPRKMHYPVLGRDVPFATPSGKYRFQVPEAMDQGCPEIPSLVDPCTPPASYPYRLLAVHKVDQMNSQLANLEWVAEGSRDQGTLWLGPGLARLKGIISGDKLTLYNQIGEISLRAKIRLGIPDDLLVCLTRQDMNGKSVNCLTGKQETDLGRVSTGFPGVAYHDTFVNFTLW
ncbi:molybdopterin-dependent oxidoreductase [Desulfitobacterium hafniense]|uniref:molybdopterin-dependent oxidoreductase n=1 Tax=Desulfitobacterium hafniense TaxID=49338 RepID=UPI00039FDED1|nr:molybdopterin-dependent oxidoreductase [Desulfitobacterium hafniense]